jgi:hypothetical protein
MAYDGSVRIRTELDTKGFRDGRKQIESGLSGLRSSLAKAASAIGVAFGTAAVANFAKESVEAASALQNALAGLESIVEGQGRSFAKAQAFIQDYIADGLVPMANAVTAYKNLAARGYDDTQIQQVLTALKDSAAYGRQASLSLGEAVQSASEGLKNENSILVDNAGVTKNVSLMWKDYAQSIGKGVQSLTQQEKIQAEVNGILSETRFQTGDATKAAGSYSGQVAQLGFNFNNLKVAVGNAGMALAQSMLPAVNSIVLSLTQAANVAAQFITALFGGKTAAQNQKTAATASQAAKQEAKLADEITAAAKAAENAQGSIDELNIIQQDAGVSGATGGASSSTAGDTAAGAIGEIGAAVTVSPKIQAAADKVRKFLEDLRQALKEFSPLLSGIAAGFLTAFSMKWVAGAAANLKKLAGTSSLFKGIAAAAGAVAANFKATGKLFPSLNAGFKQLRASLSNTTKAMVGAAGCVAAFVSVKSAVSDLTLGNIDLETALLNIVPALAVVGTALYAALGPWGLLAGAIAAAAGAMLGYADAQKRIVVEALDESFYDGVGVGIGEIADGFKRAWEEVDIANRKILEYSETLENNRTKTQELQQEIGAYEAILKSGGQITDDQAHIMEQAYQDLYAVAKENLDTEFQVLISTYGKHLEEAAAASGLNVGYMLADLQKLKGDMDSELSDLTARQSELRKKLIDGTITAAEQEEYNKISMLISDLAVGVSETQTRLDQQVKEIGEINFGNEEKALEALQGIHDTAQQLLEDNNEAKIQAVNSVDNLKKRLNAELEYGLIDQEEFNKRLELFNSTADVIEQSYNEKEAEIKNSITGIYDKIQEQMVYEIEGAEAAIRSKWAEMSDFSRWLNGWDENAYVRNGLETFKKETIGPLTDFLETSFQELELQGSQWATDTIEGIFGAMFSPTSFNTAMQVTGYDYVKPASEAISEALKAIGKEATPSAQEAGKNTMDGMADGMKENAGQVSDAASSAAKGAQDAIKKADDSHSPSRKYYGFGKDDMEGFRNGIRDNAGLAAAAANNAAIQAAKSLESGANSQKTAISNAFGGLFNAVLDKADIFCERLRGAINDALSGMRAAVGSVSLGAGGTLRFSAMPPVKIPRLATGAVIPPNAQFAAILGDQTHGRNLEAPESLIRQIVREESGGASQELIDRIDRLIRAVEEKDMTVTVGITDREVAQANQRGLRSLGYPVRGT